DHEESLAGHHHLRLFRRFGRLDRITVVAQQSLERGAHVLLVIDDEDGGEVHKVGVQSLKSKSKVQSLKSNARKAQEQPRKVVLKDFGHWTLGFGLMPSLRFLPGSL